MARTNKVQFERALTSAKSELASRLKERESKLKRLSQLETEIPLLERTVAALEEHLGVRNAASTESDAAPVQALDVFGGAKNAAGNSALPAVHSARSAGNGAGSSQRPRIPASVLRQLPKDYRDDSEAVELPEITGEKLL